MTTLDPIERKLRDIIRRRRAAFYVAAVEEGIIDDVQSRCLMALHEKRDAEQDRREMEAIARERNE